MPRRNHNIRGEQYRNTWQQTVYYPQGRAQEERHNWGQQYPGQFQQPNTTHHPHIASGHVDPNTNAYVPRSFQFNEVSRNQLWPGRHGATANVQGNQQNVRQQNVHQQNVNQQNVNQQNVNQQNVNQQNVNQQNRNREDLNKQEITNRTQDPNADSDIPVRTLPDLSDISNIIDQMLPSGGEDVPTDGDISSSVHNNNGQWPAAEPPSQSGHQGSSSTAQQPQVTASANHSHAAAPPINQSESSAEQPQATASANHSHATAPPINQSESSAQQPQATAAANHSQAAPPIDQSESSREHGEDVEVVIDGNVFMINAAAQSWNSRAAAQSMDHGEPISPQHRPRARPRPRGAVLIQPPPRIPTGPLEWPAPSGKMGEMGESRGQQLAECGLVERLRDMQVHFKQDHIKRDLKHMTTPDKVKDNDELMNADVLLHYMDSLMQIVQKGVKRGGDKLNITNHSLRETFCAAHPYCPAHARLLCGTDDDDRHSEDLDNELVSERESGDTIAEEEEGCNDGGEDRIKVENGGEVSERTLALERLTLFLLDSLDCSGEDVLVLQDMLTGVGGGGAGGGGGGSSSSAAAVAGEAGEPGEVVGGEAGGTSSAAAAPAAAPAAPAPAPAPGEPGEVVEGEAGAGGRAA